MRRKWLLFLLTAVLVLALSACKKQTVDLSPYLSVQYEGMNGQAVAVADIDYASFEHEIMAGWSEKDKDFAHLGKLTQLELSMEVKMDRFENLSNQDAVRLEVAFDPELAEQLGLEIVGTEKTFRVEGLKDPVAVDPFAQALFGPEKPVEFYLEGISPRLKLKMSDSSGYEGETAGIRYEADKTEDICNGDVITVTAALENPREQERVLSRSQIQFTVQDYPMYLEEFSQIPGENLQQLNQALEEEFKEKLNNLFNLELAEMSGTASADTAMNVRMYLFGVGPFTIQEGGFINRNNDNKPRLDKIVVPFSCGLEKIIWYEDGIEQSLENKTVYGYAAFSYLMLDGEGGLAVMPGEQPYLKIQDTLYEDWDTMMERANLERADLN